MFQVGPSSVFGKLQEMISNRSISIYLSLNSEEFATLDKLLSSSGHALKSDSIKPGQIEALYERFKISAYNHFMMLERNRASSNKKKAE